MTLLPVTVAAVVGGPDPRSWVYQLTMPGPSEAVTLQRPGEAILSFRLRVDSRTPWKGKTRDHRDRDRRITLSAWNRRWLPRRKSRVARVICSRGAVTEVVRRRFRPW